jgi:hypothetical protein
VAKFTGPEVHSSQPSQQSKVDVSIDPNAIPDLDDLF